MTTQNTPPDGLLVAETNERIVLHWIHRFGGLTTRQLARLHWPGKASGMRMAQRTIERLLAKKMLLQRRLSTGGCVYVLGERGAHYLREHGTGNVSARGHRDLKFDKPMHRMIANEFVIDQHLSGVRIWTEFEVQRGLAPVPEVYVTEASRRQRKIPDAVTEWEGSLCWIEVENAWKSKRRLAQLMQLAELLLSPTNGYEVQLDGHSAFYAEMLFILPADRNFRSVVRAVQDSTLTNNAYSRLFLARVEMSPRLLWNCEIGRESAATILRWLDSQASA